jgi:hypothetical protein
MTEQELDKKSWEFAEIAVKAWHFSHPDRVISDQLKTQIMAEAYEQYYDLYRNLIKKAG